MWRLAMKQSKIMWIVAYYPRNNPEQVQQLGIHKTKKAAMQHAKVNMRVGDRENVTCVMKAQIVESEQ
jgi:hypothetical protein